MLPVWGLAAAAVRARRGLVRLEKPVGVVEAAVGHESPSGSMRLICLQRSR